MQCSGPGGVEGFRTEGEEEVMDILGSFIQCTGLWVLVVIVVVVIILFLSQVGVVVKNKTYCLVSEASSSK